VRIADKQPTHGALRQHDGTAPVLSTRTAVMWNQPPPMQQQQQQPPPMQQGMPPAFFAPYEPAPPFATATNADVRGRIDKLVAYVCKNGPQFEQMVG
jgi:hypothetical protein